MTAALVIIDVQNAILRGAGAAARQPVIDQAFESMVGRLAALHKAARRQGIPVILIQHDGEPGHRLARGGEGWQLRDEIAPQDGDIVVHKSSCDSFFATDLQERLKECNVARLIVGGCMTQFCVDTTCRRAVSLGYTVTLIGNGHMTGDMGDLTFQQIIAHHNALLDGFDAGAHSIKVASVDQLRF